MKSRISHGILLGTCALFMTAAFMANAQVTTMQLSGTVAHIEGNQLVVKMSSGEFRTFTVAPDRTALIDGKEMRLNEIKVGTRLTATVTETSTPATQRTVQTLDGKVWFAQGNTVILTLPNGTNRQYNIKGNDIKFKVAGKDATVFDLRKGMNVHAEKITEEPIIEVTRNTQVTGSAPVAPVVAQTPTAAPSTPAPAPAPAPAATRPASRPEPAPAPAPVAAAPAAPARLPKTASPLPLAALWGGVFMAAGLGLRQLRRRSA